MRMGTSSCSSRRVVASCFCEFITRCTNGSTNGGSIERVYDDEGGNRRNMILLIIAINQPCLIRCRLLPPPPVIAAMGRLGKNSAQLIPKKIWM
mmetsp:Transcript_44387/g.74037  ORF Transcript_44387/g.74037 Transcript_44387/m.74037 type:complete len:94 (-) Transcript_44387:3-284(-)